MKNKKFAIKWTQTPGYRGARNVNKPSSRLLKQLELMLLKEPKNVRVRSQKKPKTLTYTKFKSKLFRKRWPFRKSSASLNRIFFKKFTNRFRKQYIPVFKKIFGFKHANLYSLNFTKWFNRFFYPKKRFLAFQLFNLVRKFRRYRHARRKISKKVIGMPREFRVKYRQFLVRAITKSAPKFFKGGKKPKKKLRRFYRSKRIYPFFLRKEFRFKKTYLFNAFSNANYGFFSIKKRTHRVIHRFRRAQYRFGNYSFSNFSEESAVSTKHTSAAQSLLFFKDLRGFSHNLQSLQLQPAASLFISQKQKVNKLRYFLTNSHRRIPVKFFSKYFGFVRGSKKVSTAFTSLKRKNLKWYKKRLHSRFIKKHFTKKLSFSLTQQGKKIFNNFLSKRFFARKNYLRFKPFLGVFDRYNRVNYRFKRRRIKFFNFFKRYYKLFRNYSGAKKSKSRKFSKKFKRQKYYLHVFKSINNIFTNVSTPLGRSIYVYSAGRTQYRGSKRLSPIAIETMGKNISEILKNTEIFDIFVVFHCPIDFLTRSLLRGLRTNVKFSGFKYYLNRPHNGLRKRASRRV